ncbi:Sli15p Ecym_2560 [Eremothecium cymbalariae DBVPG|uniref:Inner centromere protein ARK-binding domain-containing protein n=1 Tax=Eremothecium cymbalariae (strain CBS 270.75 / DBVPG 7215 / KCTC 17166 / NRRL Y-17582) TaxID=931890 RepID=G8JQC1_ERECY|nr:Hypothetical protein Ecym_2560 [Eremothecium cymbalariae DBVPG\
MDWAIKAVKKRMKSRGGDSRSIVESLNRLNDTVLEGHDEMNGLLHEANDWLNFEMKRVGFRHQEIRENSESSGSELTPIHKGIRVSPLNKGLAVSCGGDTIPPYNGFGQHATPRSLPVEEEELTSRGLSTTAIDTQSQRLVNVSDIDHQEDDRIKEPESATPKAVINKHEDTAKSSPWSPYKVAKTLKEGTYKQLQHESENTNSADHNTTHETDSVTEKSIIQSKISLSKSPENTFLQKAANFVPPSRDRTLRRSNMFVPLPNKDPLVVQPMVSKNKSIKNISPTVTKPLKGAVQPVSTEENEGSTKLSGTRSSYQGTKGRSGSIFDRLSSIPTKSFEKKIASRSPHYISRSPTKGTLSPEPRYFQSSKTNVNGSPARRKSTADETFDRSDDHIQATLKNIFDTQIPVLSNNELRCRNSLAAKKKNPPSGSQIKRTSLIPRLDRSVYNSKNILHTEKRGRSMTPIKRGDMTSKVRKLNFNPSPHRVVNLVTQAKPINNYNQSVQTPSKTVFTSKVQSASSVSSTMKFETEQTPLSKTAVKTPTVKTPGLIGTKLASSKVLGKTGITKAFPTDETIHSANHCSSMGQKSTGKVDQVAQDVKDSIVQLNGAHDRLTKFQLLPQAGSEKQDLRKKLDKRLSEVMRNQQEQQILRRRQEQQKRKSQLEEGKKRRTKILSDFPDNGAVKSKVNTTNSYLTKLPNQSVLYDLHTADHRSNTGSSKNNDHLNVPTHVCDTTLPDIDSDSENESGSYKILAAWAQSPFLEEQLLRQQDWDIEEIFGSIRPLHIDEVFHNSRLSKLKSRQSVSRMSVGNNNTETK